MSNSGFTVIVHDTLLSVVCPFSEVTEADILFVFANILGRLVGVFHLSEIQNSVLTVPLASSLPWFIRGSRFVTSTD